MKRRDFIWKSCAMCIGGSALSALAASCSISRYISGELVKDGLLVDKNDFRIQNKGKENYHPFLVIRNDALKFPLCLYRFGETEYVALWMQCTHQGSELQAFGSSLQCPAHGSEFDNRGNVTSGPADRQLLNFPVTLQGDQLFIDLRKKA